MKQIYLDNASTTFPKPPAMADAVYQYITSCGSNINRGCYDSAYQIEELVYETRELLCHLFHGEHCKNVVFTKNVTESLNIIIKGLLQPGDHVLVSSMEHNAVMRPLVQLIHKDVSFSRIPCHLDGTLCLDQMEALLTPQTKAVIMTHASNVCGTMMPLKEVGTFCKEHGLFFIVDCAQTAGVWPIDMIDYHIDALAFTGHKGLLGPQGIGGFLIKEHMISRIQPLLSGGTGSISHTEDIPEFMPDRFEPGTMNLPGIVGLHASLQWLNETGIDSVRKHELALTKRFLDGISHLQQSHSSLKLIGKTDLSDRTGVVSIQILDRDISQVAFTLDTDYHIMTRVGLHCAPNAHKTLGTYPTGTIRFSFGWWNTEAEIDTALYALKTILSQETFHGL